MGAPGQPEWLDLTFFERLSRMEHRHKQAQSEHRSAPRGLERLSPRQAEELQEAWRRYCQVIAELDRATAEFETPRAWRN